MIGTAIKVLKIATGEIQEDIDDDGKDWAAVALGRIGGAAPAAKLSKKRRAEIAKEAVEEWWIKASKIELVESS